MPYLAQGLRASRTVLEEAGSELRLSGKPQRPPDVAEADDTYGLAADFTAHGRPFPLLGPHGVVVDCGTLRGSRAATRRYVPLRPRCSRRAYCKAGCRAGARMGCRSCPARCRAGDQLEVGELSSSSSVMVRLLPVTAMSAVARRFTGWAVHALPALVQHFGVRHQAGGASRRRRT